MKIVAYTSPGCSHCTTLKKLFARAGVAYQNVEVGNDIPFQLFKEKFPTAGGYPHVVIDEKEIGGLVETARLFLEKGLVDSPNK
jgi:glutaredoxin